MRELPPLARRPRRLRRADGRLPRGALPCGTTRRPVRVRRLGLLGPEGARRSTTSAASTSSSSDELPEQSYPPLVPALEAAAFHFMGAPDVVTLHLQFWFLLVGFVCGRWSACSPDAFRRCSFGPASACARGSSRRRPRASTAGRLPARRVLRARRASDRAVAKRSRGVATLSLLRSPRRGACRRSARAIVLAALPASSPRSWRRRGVERCGSAARSSAACRGSTTFRGAFSRRPRPRRRRARGWRHWAVLERGSRLAVVTARVRARYSTSTSGSSSSPSLLVAIVARSSPRELGAARSTRRSSFCASLRSPGARGPFRAFGDHEGAGTESDRAIQRARSCSVSRHSCRCCLRGRERQDAVSETRSSHAPWSW